MTNFIKIKHFRSHTPAPNPSITSPSLLPTTNYQLPTVICFCLCLLASCTKSIDLDIPNQTRKLVMTAIWNKGDSMHVSVSRSFATEDEVILESLTRQQRLEKYVVPDADVQVFKNDALSETLRYDPNGYTYLSSAGNIVDANTTYKIRVTAPGFSEVTTPSLSMPALVPIQSIVVRKEVAIGDQSIATPLDELTIEFNDPPGTKNYYWLWITNSRGDTADVFPEDKDVVTPENQDIFSTLAPRAPSNKIIIKDDNFDGQNKKLVIRVPSWLLRNYYNNLEATIHLSSTNQDMYNYIKAELSIKDNPFTEPTPTYTNIANGFGIFGLCNTDKKEIQ